MAYTVADLLADPKLETVSLTPGVGERREIAWGHVCELTDPWRWLGTGALVMTTGLAIPESTEDQLAYVERSHVAGIAAVSIGENMSAPPLAPETLQRAAELDFALLETAHAMPFIVLAQAISRANLAQQQQRIATAAQLYESLTGHLQDSELQPLLDRFGEILGGALRLVPNPKNAAARGLVQEVDERLSRIPLVTPTRFALEFARESESRPDPALLQYASAAVTTLLAVTTAAHRQELARGSLLLSRLLDRAVSEETAAELLRPHGIEPPYRLTVWPAADKVEIIEETADTLLSSGVHLLHVGREMSLVLLTHDDPKLLEIIDGFTRNDRIGVSAPFARLSDAPEALREARYALIAPTAQRISRYEDCIEVSPFLSHDVEQTTHAARSLLAPLLASDRERGTELLATLRVYLEENRGIAATAERLGVHRQTLYARIARIERLTETDLATTAAVADLWLALQVLARPEAGGGSG